MRVIDKSAVLDISDRASIPCSFPNMFVLGVGELVLDASTRWLARLRCEKGENMVVSGSTPVV